MKSLSRPSAVNANLACFAAMMMWATGFPAGEVLLESWGAISLQSVRFILGVSVLLLFWILADGLPSVLDAPWCRGVAVGGLGFGLGALLLLLGQKLSDPVTPAIAAAMMPIAGAALEVVLDKRKLRLHLLIGITLAMTGGYLATGVRLGDGAFGLGALLCLVAVVLFAWATRATTRDFQELSTIGQTALTLAGGLVFSLIAFGLSVLFGFGGAEIGGLEAEHITMLLILAVPSFAFAQLLWIWAAGGLGILLASLHMNAVPFYVMVIMVMLFSEQWGWDQALGAALVGAGVLVSQGVGRQTA